MSIVSIHSRGKIHSALVLMSQNGPCALENFGPDFIGVTPEQRRVIDAISAGQFKIYIAEDGHAALLVRS